MRLFLCVFCVVAILGCAWSHTTACDPQEGIRVNLDLAWHGDGIDKVILPLYSCENLRILRSVPLARHGHVFDQRWLQKRFEDDLRYQSDAYVDASVVEQMLTPNDRANIQAVRAVEEKNKCEDKEPEDAVTPSGEEAKREFAPLDETVKTESGTTTVTMGFATPAFIIDQALNGEDVESVWLGYLTCQELDRVAQAAYVAYDIPLPGREDREYFFSIWPYNPDYSKSSANVDMKSAHQLVLLRVDAAKESKRCP